MSTYRSKKSRKHLTPWKTEQGLSEFGAIISREVKRGRKVVAEGAVYLSRESMGSCPKSKPYIASISTLRPRIGHEGHTYYHLDVADDACHRTPSAAKAWVTRKLKALKV